MGESKFPPLRGPNKEGWLKEIGGGTPAASLQLVIREDYNGSAMAVTLKWGHKYLGEGSVVNSTDRNLRSTCGLFLCCEPSRITWSWITFILNK